MGWSSGSDIAQTLIETLVKEEVEDEVRKAIYIPFLEVMTDHDWDTIDEVMGIDDVFDAVVKEWNPAYDNEEED